MPHLSFSFPVLIRPAAEQTFHITCRDFPELSLTSSGVGLLATLREVEEGLDAVIASYLERGQQLPRPSLREPGEYVVAPSPPTIAAAIRILGTELRLDAARSQD